MILGRADIDMVHHSDQPCSPMASSWSSGAQERDENADDGANVAQHPARDTVR